MSPIIPLNHKFKTNSSQRVTPLTEVRANFCVFSRQFSEQKTNKSLVQSCWGKILQVFFGARADGNVLLISTFNRPYGRILISLKSIHTIHCHQRCSLPETT